MATLVLAAAGTALGGAVGGTVAGVAAPVIGRALGAVAGGLIDQALLGGGARAVETGRVAALRVQSSREGTPVTRVFGRMRVAGTVIWASRFRETVTEAGRGRKGSAPPRTRQFSYTVSLALALCEGPIDRIGRVWADGHEVALEDLPWRLHRGTEDQQPDPLILAMEGADAAPAFRGTAYLVFEDLPLEPWHNRVPQFSVEVCREPQPDRADAPEMAPPLSSLVRAVALSPGSGEFSLDTEPVLRRLGPGQGVWENLHGPEGRADVLLSLDQLASELPECRSVLLIVSWFGDDLRCGVCQLRPGVETRDKITEPVAWQVAGLGRSEARVVGQTPEGHPIYGGTPSDRGVIQTIKALRARGYRVVFYPFLLMDIAPGNGLPDPYGGAEQPAYPWRGRIVGRDAGGWVDPAEVGAFFGQAAPGDFQPQGETVRYAGPPEWSLRRMVLHYAHLCAQAGGVEAFCIGSELRGLTTLREVPGRYPAVEALAALAGDVRAVLGDGPTVTYAADWSEYFGHHPQDGSGDVVFHLDPLWSHPAIDVVGIDNYMPLADWRDGDAHLDAAVAGSIYDLGYLRGNVEGGEGFDWYYASEADRREQVRTPITDGVHGEPWVFRYKDIRSWWSQPHHNRLGGVRAAEPTGWVPCSKPIWFTEIGCAAVDKGANQPNVFLDAKSSESALPWFSNGTADPHMQRRFLQACLSYWDTPGVNPVSPVYGGPMLDTGATHVWTWDARRWPDFPRRLGVWSDGLNHRAGHWITGRLGAAGLAEVVAEICAASGVVAVDVSALHGTVEGYLLDRLGTGRAALQPLMLAYGFDAVESGGVLRFVPRGAAPVMTLAEGDLVAPPEGGPLRRVRGAGDEAAGALRLGFVDPEADYAAGVEASHGAAEAGAAALGVDLPLALSRPAARAVVRRFLDEAQAARDRALFTLPPTRLALEPGDVVRLGGERFRLDRVTLRAGLEVEATRVAARPVAAVSGAVASSPLPDTPVPPAVVVLDLPALSAAATSAPHVAALAVPWAGALDVWGGAEDDGYRWLTAIERPATLGVVDEAVPAARAARWWRGSLRVRLAGGALASVRPEAVLAGGNLAALWSDEGGVEVIQFAGAVLEAPGLWRLDGVLRGQAGTDAVAGQGMAAGAVFLLLDGAPVALPEAAVPAGMPLHLRVVPQGLGHDHPAAVHRVVVPQAVALRPRAPVRGTATRDAAGVTLRWVRRSRVDDDRWAALEAPLGEETEAYRVQVFDGARLAREAIVAAPTFTYGDAERAADGVGGAAVVRVAQLSAAVGAGAELEIEIDG